MSKHTPGPWEYAICPNNRHEIVSPLPDRLIIASVWPTPATPETASADARLIASAPDLYAAAKRIADKILYNGDCYGEDEAALIQAVAKAEGKS